MDLSTYFDNFLEALNLGNKSVIGIDIGQNAIRIAEVSFSKNDYKLQRFVYKLLPEGCLIEDEIVLPEEVIGLIKDLYKKGKFSNKNASIGLSGPNTTTKRMQVINGTYREIADQVEWESEQYIPFGAEQSVISFSIISQNIGGGADVMMAAVREDIAESFCSVIKEAGLRPKIIDLDLFALSNMFELSVSQKVLTGDDGILIIDFGSQKTNLIIYKNGTIVYTRELPMGGLGLTEEIQREMGLSYEEVEDLKVTGDESGNLPQEIIDVIENVLSSYFAEIKKTINFFLSATTEVTLETCYITGGGSRTPGFVVGLEKFLNLKVYPLDPLENIKYNSKKFSKEELDYIRKSGVIALGLAIRKIKYD